MLLQSLAALSTSSYTACIQSRPNGPRKMRRHWHAARAQGDQVNTSATLFFANSASFLLLRHFHALSLTLPAPERAEIMRRLQERMLRDGSATSLEHSRTSWSTSNIARSHGNRNVTVFKPRDGIIRENFLIDATSRQHECRWERTLTLRFSFRRIKAKHCGLIVPSDAF